ncbi:MAG TPA: adenylate/guanylate cyclase domain-containing protein [Geminicoccaceae bacterium]|nr:adenylate/guanylate cyclase domain-containing protein [Geminicoccaceae bacterium]
MSPETARVAILLADISGSTPLYEAVGDAPAQRLIGEELVRLQAAIDAASGVCIRQKGDDVLACFAEPSQAFRAVRAMLARPAGQVLRIHGGLHYGPVVRADGDIFGEAVNLTARLAALANADEALLSRSFVDRLAPHETTCLRPLDRIRLKGVGSPIEVYSFVDDDPAMQTQAPLSSTQIRPARASWPVAAALTIVLTHGGGARRCGESESMLIGRSDECDIVLSRPWISRKHAMLTMRDGKAVLADRSSTGTYVAIAGGHELLLRRESIVLTGNGLISPGLPPARPEAEPIRFEIVRR